MSNRSGSKLFAKVISRCHSVDKELSIHAYSTKHVLGFNKCLREGAQWLSGRVLDSRPKGSGFEPHRRHCVVVLEQDTFILA